MPEQERETASSVRLALMGHGETTISMLQPMLIESTSDESLFASVSRLHPLDDHLVLRVPSVSHARKSLIALREELDRLERSLA